MPGGRGAGASTAPAPDETVEPGEDKPKLGLSMPQLIGGSLAAVSSAVVASFLGVAGTLIGAALASIVTTVSSAVYTQAARSAGARVTNRLGPVADSEDAATTDKAVSTTTQATTKLPTADATVPVSTTAYLEKDTGEYVVTAARKPWWRARMPQIALGSVAIFLVSMAALTGIEMALGHPVSNASTSGTSVTKVVSDVSGTSSDSTAPSDTQTTPSDEKPAGTQPSDGSSAPSDEQTPADEQSAPAGGSDAGQTATTDSGAGDQSTQDSGSVDGGTNPGGSDQGGADQGGADQGGANENGGAAPQAPAPPAAPGGAAS